MLYQLQLEKSTIAPIAQRLASTAVNADVLKTSSIALAEWARALPLSFRVRHRSG